NTSYDWIVYDAKSNGYFDRGRADGICHFKYFPNHLFKSHSSSSGESKRAFGLDDYRCVWWCGGSSDHGGNGQCVGQSVRIADGDFCCSLVFDCSGFWYSSNFKINLMYQHDKRIVMTLDAGGTNFVFSAMSGYEEQVQPYCLPSHADQLERCLETL